MTRKRFLHADMWQDTRICSMSRDERLLFVGLITLADDQGRLVANPILLRGALYMADTNVTVKKVKAWRDAIVAKNPNLRLYTSDGLEYIQLSKYSHYQQPSHPTPSRLPPPPGDAPHPDIVLPSEAEIAGASQNLGSSDNPLRRAILVRDGFTCRYCGNSSKGGQHLFDADGHTWNIDHVIPVVAGGQTILENLVTACRGCNYSKNGRTPDEAKMTLLPVPASSRKGAAPFRPENRSSVGTGVGLGDEDAARSLLPLLRTVTGWPLDESKDAALLAELLTEYASLEPTRVIRDLARWTLDNPLGKNPRLRLQNFFRKALEFQERDRFRSRVVTALPSVEDQEARLRAQLRGTA